MSDRNRYRGEEGVDELTPVENVRGDHGRRGTAGEDAAERPEIKGLRIDVQNAEPPEVAIAGERQEPSLVMDSAGQKLVSPTVRRVAMGLWLFFFVILPLSVVGLLVAVDPYYVFGSPSLHGFNAVRPYYETYVVVAKPYQVWRMRPEAVVLGASSSEVGIDPRHPGWGTKRVFNFSIPSSISYLTMLSFLHAQKLGAKQAVVSLDLFSFNANYSVSTDERRFLQEASAEFAQYLDDALPSRSKAVALKPEAEPSDEWDEALYLAIHQDVTAAVASHIFKDGREHWEQAGRAEKRVAGPPEGWDEAGYLQAHIDVARGVATKFFLSGFHHFYVAGRAEGRLGGLLPNNWNEGAYLAANPDVRARVALGLYRTGFIHYAAIGRKEGRLGGLPPANMIEKFRLQHPGFDKALFNILEFTQLALAMRDAASTPFRQKEPAEFDELGMRVWENHDELMRKLGGWGTIFHNKFIQGGGDPWLPLPILQHCFSNPETGMTTFDPFRFMLRRAYAEGTDLRMFTTPVHSAIYQIFDFAGLTPRYEQWLRELVRINAEEANRAGREPFPLWDFGSVSSVTSEPIPGRGDMTPMKYFWDYSHYSKATGDLILDRVLDYRDPSRPLTNDFGVRLDDANIDSQIAANRARLAEWRKANPELASEIVAATGLPTALNRQSAATCW